MIKENKSCIRLLADPIQIQNCKTLLMDLESEVSQLAKVLNLAGNEVRLKILLLLKTEGELCPCDLSDILGMSVPAVSQHLRKLKDADVIKRRKEGQTIYYSLKSNHTIILNSILNNISINEKIVQL
jgi:DNA-binding transcriptional ArsR family regulator